MNTPGGPNLARVTIAAPERRMDVALPDNMLVAELLPHLLRHAEGGLGETGDLGGGWVLRRATGAALEPHRNLTAQGIRDGELLHLKPVREDWPELAYDDVVEVIASGSRRAGRAWAGAATRDTGLAITAVALLMGLAGLAFTGPQWRTPGVIAIGVALALTVGGVLLSRAFRDAGAGAVVAAAGLPYAFFGGAWLIMPGDAGFLDTGAPGLLLGSAALLVLSLLGHTGVAGLPRLFVAGIAASLTGLLAALLSIAGITAAGAAAVALTTAIGLLPAYPVLAGWLGRLPFPELPSRAEEILADKPTPRRSDVFAAVVRASEVLTGLLLSTAICSVVSIVYLTAQRPDISGVLLIVAAVAALLLRARLLPMPRQRVPLLVAGLTGLAVLGLGAAYHADGRSPGMLLLAGAGVAAVIALSTALVFSRRQPSPYLGRAADVFDVVAIMALIPLACAVIGIFGSIRGLFASFGG
ncbi:type VII secretion integral membrane protein EccD [Actinoplanes campanulatus]|uniref:Type VII secretion integral membrane protein EccD n=1 Tax=Actinoplanes campanulatus TaxID=113559 RepID=A0A7W5AHD1_9ACTN|nr:type VII secretion integral membrane protein EccD [Actinoplanes campanulatus]MBB3096331.1 type VII secretion integral membrane protein EccD [Actinoplanes campanulatus]GGN18993.1 type VII secretion integral membrane protein EccD [Actinoplanes campanulatus]GID42589.1 type VII secretion integral membrane protein EccD [Actinoplanes campanulatus]